MKKPHQITVTTVCAVALSFVPLLLYAKGLVPCGGSAPEKECTFLDFVLLADKIKNALIAWVALPIAGALFAWAGFLYLSAAGDEGQVKKAHGIFQNVFIGLILALAAWLIIDFVIDTFVDSGRGKAAREFI